LGAGKTMQEDHGLALADVAVGYLVIADAVKEPFTKPRHSAAPRGFLLPRPTLFAGRTKHRHRGTGLARPGPSGGETEDPVEVRVRSRAREAMGGQRRCRLQVVEDRPLTEEATLACELRAGRGQGAEAQRSGSSQDRREQSRGEVDPGSIAPQARSQDRR